LDRRKDGRTDRRTEVKQYTPSPFGERGNNKKKKLYCAFIDFAKAFDTVWRKGLWHKLLGNEFNGQMYQVIFNMYSGIKSRVLYNGEMSEYFPCNIGVRQGENLSPFLLSIYLNSFLKKGMYVA
jgi:hypothetical protein